jgi:signal transduction histidine kinase/DNA-binding response OmpR family regulator
LRRLSAICGLPIPSTLERRAAAAIGAILGRANVSAMQSSHAVANRMAPGLKLGWAMFGIASAALVAFDVDHLAEPLGQILLTVILIGCGTGLGLHLARSRSAKTECDLEIPAGGALQARIAELTQANDQLTREKLAALESSQTKAAFLANMSHEIRTPMTAILGYADTLMEPNQTQADRAESINIIRRNAAHLLELINDILDISKIEANRMTLEKIPTDVPELLSDVVALVRQRAAEKGLWLFAAADGLIPKKIETDPMRLRQILLNLVSNAVKFTETGEVKLTVMFNEIDHRQGEISFSVSDTGVGMTPEQQSLLFQPFSQVDGSIARQYGGTGLGLAISRRLADMLGGELTLRSQPERGSTFTLRIPVQISAGSGKVHTLGDLPQFTPALADIKPAHDWKLQGRVLLIEDGEDNQRLVCMHLRRAGLEVIVAEDGTSGIEAFQAAAKTKRPFNLVILDIHLPRMDGYAVATAIRAESLTVPIMAVTAFSRSGERQRCLEAGCTAYLSKPVEREALLSTIAGYLSPASAAPPDPTKIRSMFSADRELREILAEFIAKLPKQVRELTDLIDQGNIQPLRRALHQIKGAGGGYGFSEMTQAAAAAENTLSETHRVEAATKDIYELIRIIRSVEGYDQTGEIPRAESSDR